jgi:hypothetical protein
MNEIDMLCFLVETEETGTCSRPYWRSGISSTRERNSASFHSFHSWKGGISHTRGRNTRCSRRSGLHWLYSADLIGWQCHVRHGHTQLSLWLVLHRKRIKTEELPDESLYLHYFLDVRVISLCLYLHYFLDVRVINLCLYLHYFLDVRVNSKHKLITLTSKK